MSLDHASEIVLQKMISHRVFGGKHYGMDDLKRGVPTHERGNIEKAIKNLVKKNLILKHPTSYGMQYSLNHNKLDLIGRLLEYDVSD